MNSKFQKVMVAIIAILVFVVTFFGSSREQVIVETKKIVNDSNNINNKYLVGVEWLNENIHNANLVILDIRSKKQYDEGHIPGAINVSWNQFIGSSLNNDSNNTNDENSNNETSNSGTSSNQNSNTESNSDNQNDVNSSNNSTTESNNNNNNNNQGNTNNSNSENNEENSTKNWTASLNKKNLSKELQDLGITQKSIVVIYGDSNSQNLDDLGKFSWMFRMIGIDSKMLNGGYDNWKAQGFESIKGVPLPKKSNIEIENFVTNKAITLNDIKKNISKLKIVQLVNDIKPKNTNTSNSQTNVANNQNGANNNSNVNENEQNQANNSSSNTGSGVEVNSINSNNSNNSNSSNGNNSTNTSQSNLSGGNQEYITESNAPPAGVIQIKLSELLNPNGTIKSVNRLDNLFNNKGINQNDIILFYNSDKGNIAFMSLILKMAGFDNIKYYNANLSQVAAIRNEIINEKNNPNSNSGNTGNVDNNSSNSNSSNATNNSNSSNGNTTNNSSTYTNNSNTTNNNTNN